MEQIKAIRDKLRRHFKDIDIDNDERAALVEKILEMQQTVESQNTLIESLTQEKNKQEQ